MPSVKRASTIVHQEKQSVGNSWLLMVTSYFPLRWGQHEHPTHAPPTPTGYALLYLQGLWQASAFSLQPQPAGVLGHL